MADRFPSLEDFDEAAPTSTAAADLDDDFLARERAALGEDATQFAGANDTTGFTDNGDDDLLGGSHEHQSHNNDDINDFQSSFPAIETGNANFGPGGTITGSTLTYNSGYNTSSSEPEPEVIRAWRERRDADLAERADKAERKKQNTIKEAQKNIDEYYENYNMKKDKAIAKTRKDAEEFLASRDDTTSGGTSWERIAKLVDLSGKGAKGGAAGGGKDRFRELLVGLKKDENAPGASGV